MTAPGDPPPTPVAQGEGTTTVAGRWTYHWGARRRPFVHPVTTPAGHVLTREAPDDHPWHHALWFAIKYVDGDNFWEEMEPYGVLRHDDRPEVVEAAGGVVALRGSLTWTRPDRETVALTEERTLTHVPLGPDAYAIDLDTTLVPGAPCRLDRTPFTTWGGYGGLTVRGAGDWTDTTLLLADGSTHDRVLGQASAWCDLTGTPPGGAEGDRAGIALLDHPGNRRHPTPFYGSTRADTYGDDGWSNFLNAAFLWHEPLDLAAGEELRVRHRVIVHDGVWERDRLAAAWADLQ
ncbi:MAG TPA: PmoA family protein [Acidimicrobiales bacterium]|nr:PmoA family protein [Acidimicrobiales bacterium]